MKIKKITAVILTLLLLAGITAALPVTAAAALSVWNGDFEEVNEEGSAKYWSFTPGATTVTDDAEGAYSGNYVKLTGPDQHVTGTTITGLTTGKTYVLSFAVKSQNKNIAMLGIDQRNEAEDRSITSATPSSWPVTDGAWRKVSHTFVLAEGADSVRITLRTLTSAYYTAEATEFVCYDAVSLESLGDERVLNGDMESVTEGAIDNWTVSDSENVIADTNADAGTYSMRLTGAGGGKVVRAYQSVDAPYAEKASPITATYKLTVRVSIPENLTGTGLRISVYRDSVNTTTWAPATIGGTINSSNGAISGGMTTATDGFVTFSAVFGKGNTGFNKAILTVELEGTGVVYIDDVSVTPIAAGTVANGDFEAFTKDVSDTKIMFGEGSISGTADYSIVRDGEAFAGEGYFRYTSTSETGYPYIRVVAGGLPSAAGVYRVDFMYRSSNGTSGPSIYGDVAASQTKALETDYSGSYADWTRCTAFLQKPEGDTHLYIRFSASYGVTRYLDNVTVELDETRMAFHDSDRAETMKKADVANRALRVVSETELTEVPNFMVGAYKTVEGKKVLCGVQVAAAPASKVLTVGEKSWYTYTYNCDIPAATDAEYLEAFAFTGGLVPVADKEKAQ